MPSLATTPYSPGHPAAVSDSSLPSDPAQTPPPAGRLDLDRTQAVAVVPPASLNSNSDSVEGAARFPRVGVTFLGFELSAELGSGAFGKVFLARQLALAGRPVALKVTTRPTAEPAQLAKLHHTNIVPIYSVHDAAPLQAVCMPYLGARTLADVVVPYLQTGVFPATALPNASTKALARTTTARPAAPRPSKTSAVDPAPAARELPGVLDGLTVAAQVTWVLRMAKAIADGLAHAHERGILHLDLKPANILIADDGTALLLDFNLSRDLAAGPREQTGGTLPYMAPEQLDGFRDRDDSRLDARTDLYGLGVILYELLAGQHPFPRAAGAVADVSRMVLDRRAGPARLRTHNPAVPHTVESIVETLLQPDPARRYPTAAALADDLARQLADRPLAFAPNPSARERLGKWRRRNPRLGSVVLTASLALAVVGLGGGLAHHADARAAAVAAESHRLFLSESADLRVDLVNRSDAARREAAQAAATTLLARYGLEVGQPWAPSDAYIRLPEPKRRELAARCGELCRLTASSVMIPARGRPGGEARGPAANALAWHALAASCYAEVGTPAALHAERAELLLAAERPAEPAPAARPDAEAEDDALPELFLAGARDFLAGRYGKAAVALERVAVREPTHAAAQFLIAVCLHEQGDYDLAAERYLVVRSLLPANGRASLNRGTIALIQGRPGDAEREFADALAREPRLADAAKFRGVALTRLNRLTDAEAELTRCLELDAGAVQAYLTRAEARGKLGDAAGAEADRQAARNCTPRKADDYVARANMKAATSAADAEKDLRHATELNPHSPAAWQNLARMAAQRGDLKEALRIQDRAVTVAPEFAPARMARATLLARLGERRAAHADVAAGIKLSRGADVQYQAAAVYAMTAAEHPADARVAVAYLRDALRAGFRDFARLAADPAFDAVRDDAGYREVVRAAKSLVGAVPEPAAED